MEQYSDPDWPPGTVRLADSNIFGESDRKGDIVLQPRPTNNPNDPLNWPNWQKYVNFGLASFYAMMVFAFVNATSPTWGPLADELGFSDQTLTDTYAIGCATLAIGAPMLIPFALKYGSRPVYVISSIAQFGVSIWAARTQTVGDWWGVNSVQCWLGALAEVLVQMTIAEVFFVHQRGRMNAIYIWVYSVGSNLAIVAAGFVTQNMGWRWVWWWFVIFFGVQIILFAFGFEETKFLHVETLEGRQASVVVDPDTQTLPTGAEPGIDEKKSAREADVKPMSDLRDDSSGSKEARASPDPVKRGHTVPRKTYLQRLSLLTTSPGSWNHFLRHSYQPFMILFTIPGVMFCSLVYAILMTYGTVMTTAVSLYMLDPPYNFDAAQIGLMSLAPFIGNTIGSIVVGPVSDWLVLRLARKNDGIYEPEMRFWAFLPFIPFQIAGAWWFGYALPGGASWAEVAVAYGICNFGTAPLEALALVYLLDAYPEIIGDSLTALTFVRNLFSTIFVFALPAWVDAVGISNVFNTIGALGAFIFSFGALFLWKGKDFRRRTVRLYTYYAERQFKARD